MARTGAPGLERASRLHYLEATISRFSGAFRLQTHGPLGTLWVGIALGCFYVALIWLNSLLGMVLTPLFIMPLTRLMDRRNKTAE